MHTRILSFHFETIIVLVNTRAYDADLAAEVAAQFGAEAVLRLGDAASGADIEVPRVGNDAWSSVLYVIVAQMLAVIWSDRLGFNVDNPFEGGNLTRVVSGVKLHPLPDVEPKLFGAIDLGGTKIEACLFDERLDLVAKRRVTTPKKNYADLLDAIVDEVRWLEETAGVALAVGIGIPGLIDPATGVSTTANLPATGRTLSSDLSARLGRPTPVANDCKCFVLSEANGGAGAGRRTVFGLVLGTGVGGGISVDGKVVLGLNGLPGEVGHFGLPAELVARHKLPLPVCGCGRTGCYETLVSGPGISRIAEHLIGRAAEPAAIAAAAAAGDAVMGEVFDIWLALLAELVHTIQLTVDPDCVVLGDGLFADRRRRRSSREGVPPPQDAGRARP